VDLPVLPNSQTVLIMRQSSTTTNYYIIFHSSIHSFINPAQTNETSFSLSFFFFFFFFFSAAARVKNSSGESIFDARQGELGLPPFVPPWNPVQVQEQYETFLGDLWTPMIKSRAAAQASRP
jgi:hypothetical protein